MVAISAFMTGLDAVGPATAAIVSTFEPVVTVALAMLWFGERLGPVQVAGGAVVLTAVLVLAATSQAPAALARPAVPG